MSNGRKTETPVWRRWILLQLPYIGAVGIAVALRIAGRASWDAAAALVIATMVYGLVERRRSRRLLAPRQDMQHTP